MNPYKILGVSSTASFDEIKKAYREKAAKHHPDHGGDQWAFEQITQAFEFLKQQSKENAGAHSRTPEKSEPSGTTKTNDKTAHRKTPPTDSGPTQSGKNSSVPIQQVKIRPKKTTLKSSRKKSSAWTTVIGTLLGLVSALIVGWFFLNYLDQIQVSQIAKNSETAGNSSDSSKSTRLDSTQSSRDKMPTNKQQPDGEKRQSPRPRELPPRSMNNQVPKTMAPKTPATVPEPRPIPELEDERKRKSEELKKESFEIEQNKANNSEEFPPGLVGDGDADVKDDDNLEEADEQDDIQVIMNYLGFLDQLHLDTDGKNNVQIADEIKEIRRSAEKELPKKTLRLRFPVSNVSESSQDGIYIISFDVNQGKQLSSESFVGSFNVIHHKLSAAEAKRIDSSWQVELRGKLSIEEFLSGYSLKSYYPRAGSGYWIAVGNERHISGTRGITPGYLVLIDNPQVKLVRPK